MGRIVRSNLLFTLMLALGLAGGPAVQAARLDNNAAIRQALPAGTDNAWELKPVRLPDLDGKMHTLHEWSGKVIMLNFWASWCSPCQYEIPEFIEYQEKYADKGLQLVGIGVDEARKLKNVARTLGINYPVLAIEEGRGAVLMREWGNRTGIIPYTVIIDREGRIRYIHRGQMGEYTFSRYVLPLLDS